MLAVVVDEAVWDAVFVGVRVPEVVCEGVTVALWVVVCVGVAVVVSVPVWEGVAAALGVSVALPV